MRVLIDKYIPFLDDVLEPYFDVQHLAPEDITSQSVQDADALIIRTRTHVDSALLDGSRVRFVATATIGFDHIDTEYCRRHDIKWVSCPGCNAQAVCDYVEEVLDTLVEPSPNNVIGVVGYGHVGSLVARMAERKGLQVIVSDPPLGIGVDSDEIARKCNIITLHTPLTHDGEYPTYHLVDETFLRQCKPNMLLINAARGGVVDEEALLQRTDIRCAIDCWEVEPTINQALVERADLASYHIAGYSVAGKMNASQMCLDALCKFFGLPILSINKKIVPLQGDSEHGWLTRITRQLKAQPQQFEYLRKQYKLR